MLQVFWHEKANLAEFGGDIVVLFTTLTVLLFVWLMNKKINKSLAGYHRQPATQHDDVWNLTFWRKKMSFRRNYFIRLGMRGIQFSFFSRYSYSLHFILWTFAHSIILVSNTWTPLSYFSKNIFYFLFLIHSHYCNLFIYMHYSWLFFLLLFTIIHQIITTKSLYLKTVLAIKLNSIMI